MSTCHPRRVTRKSAERTLAALAHGASRHDEPVAELLSALFAPSLDCETAGERQALSALTTARQEPSAVTEKCVVGHSARRVSHRRTGTLGRRFRQLLTIKAAVAAAVLAASGMAVAAGSGELARALDDGTASSVSRPPAAARAPGVPGQSASRSTSHNTAPLGPSPTPAASTATLTGSCRVFDALDSTEQRNALLGVAFTDLIQAAHGRNQVAEFCGLLLASGSPEPHSASGAPGSPSQPVHPSHPAHPSHPPHSSPSPSPSQSTLPSQSAHPSYPVQHPDYSVQHPSHPVHPSHPSQSAHP